MSDRRRNSITWVAPPTPTPVRRGRLGPCDPCRLGDHHLCCRVACYHCPPANHRHVGSAATGGIDRAPRVPEEDR